MIKIIYKSLISLIILVLFSLIYLSIIGVKTDRFNSKIISQIKQIEPNIDLELKDVSATLDLFNFEINAKTLGTDLLYRDKTIKIETIQSKISIKSFFKKKFALSAISISTKSLAIKDLITFARLLNNDPKFFIAEKFIKKGYVVADLKLEFNDAGKITKNYKFNGLVNDGKIEIFKKYDLDKINFIFEINEKDILLNDIKLTINNNNITIPELTASKESNEYSITGKLNTDKTNFTKNEINNFLKKNFSKLEIEEIVFNSENNFKFKINDRLKVKNIDIKSNINIDFLKLQNSLKLKKIFPKIKEDLLFKNHQVKLNYKGDSLEIIGSGIAFLQDEIDQISYEIYKKKNEIRFKTRLDISKNSFKIDLLNFEKNKDTNLELNFDGKSNLNNKLILNEVSLREKDNTILLNKIIFFNNKIDSLSNILMDYSDKDGFRNKLELKNKNENYLIFGKSFNINNIIDEFLNSENNKKLEIFSRDFKTTFDIEKIYLDKNNTIYGLKGFLFLDKNEISELNLDSNFSDTKKIKFTIKQKGDEKITTLYSYKAKPFVDRYKFIKGFEEGDLDFYSIKKNDITNSILRIDNFKIQEIPVLAKLLTLASLQGIADLLTGEGIRFTDFEMKFSNKDKLMTINELYAIGPAISILMEGYIRSKKLISLRGTLVPATTINRTISSIPLIGDILVGKKVGEGVFGVSFKIKGPPGKLETTVNPIKTLTPRFITRTLEKIKKN